MKQRVIRIVCNGLPSRCATCSGIAQTTCSADKQGSDANDGRTLQSVLLRVGSVNEPKFRVGDRIWFKSGCVLQEQLTFS
jgi:hypothetical protein